MSLRVTTNDGPIPSFPRVSGDEPAIPHIAVEHGRFSPRERG